MILRVLSEISAFSVKLFSYVLMPFLLEIVATSFDSAIAAQRGGADRIELCLNLEEGGTSPPPELIQEVCRNLNIPIHVMIRPRAGSFRYTEQEFESMKSEIQTAKTLGAEGIVAGILKNDRSVDLQRTSLLVSLARPMQFTFHRAFDKTPDPRKTLEDVIACGATRILTSGQKQSAFEGRVMIRELAQMAGRRITLLAGAGINHGNASAVIRETGLHELHAARAVMNDDGQIDEELVRSLRAACHFPEGPDVH